MKVVILSTRTAHHAYFVGRIAEQFEVAAVFYETRHLQPKFPTGPLFEQEEAEFEAQHFLINPVDLPEHDVETVNATGVADHIASYGADIGIVFGCGKIKPHVFAATKAGLINIHRGISEKYRGLDSDLWAIHHDDIDSLGVTIHQVAEDLDTGDIYRCSALTNARGLMTHQIRYFTTILATELVLEVLHDYQATDKLTATPQQRGDYFSFMPLELKRETQRMFDAEHDPPAEIGYQADLFCFNQRIESQLCILLYHGVTRERGVGVENFARKHLEADVFDAQMRYISQECHLLSMEEVGRLGREGRPYPPRAVAVTFDDAFANVVSVGYPIMKKYGVPFTFYVSTAFVESDRLFWVDIIEDCINRSERDAIALPTYDAPLPIASPDDRIAAIRSVKKRCKDVANAMKDQIIATLIRESGVTPAQHGSPNYRMASWAQLAEMAKDPLVTIGSHTHSHNVMSQISPDDLRDEIRTSLGMLQERIGRPIHHFSYPEGQREHFNEKVIAELKAQGVVCCPTAICGLNPRGTDPFLLRRVMVAFERVPFPYDDARLNPIELVAGTTRRRPANPAVPA